MCNFKSCKLLPPFKELADLIAHTEEEHSDNEEDNSENLEATKYSDAGSCGDKGSNEATKERQSNTAVECVLAKSPESQRGINFEVPPFGMSLESGSQESVRLEKQHSCPICNHGFRSVVERDVHVTRHTNMKHVCVHRSCKWMFERFHELQWHYLTNHGSNSTANKFKCPVCDRMFKYQKTFKSHVQSHELASPHTWSYDQMNFKCLHDGCGWMFENFVQLRCHYAVYHKGEVVDTDEEKYRIKKPEDSFLEMVPSVAASQSVSNDTVVDQIDVEVAIKEEPPDVKFNLSATDCVEPADVSIVSNYDSGMNGISPEEKPNEDSADSKRKKNPHHLIENTIRKPKVSKKVSETRLKPRSTLKYRCLHKRCGALFDSFRQFQFHHKKKHSQSLSKGKCTCNVEDNTSLSPRRKQIQDSKVAEIYKALTVPKNTDKRRRTFIKLKESRQSSPLEHQNQKNVNCASTTRRQCPLCTRQLPHHVFKSHIRHHDRLKFKCSYTRCKWMFAKYSQIKWHFRNSHGCNNPKGNNGKEVTTNFQSSPRTILQCPRCKRHLCKKEYDNHLSKHYQLEYRCSRANCGWMFESELELNLHYENHPDMKYKCVYAKCGWLFETFHQLSDHYHHKHKPISVVEASWHRMQKECANINRKETNTFLIASKENDETGRKKASRHSVDYLDQSRCHETKETEVSTTKQTSVTDIIEVAYFGKNSMDFSDLSNTPSNVVRTRTGQCLAKRTTSDSLKNLRDSLKMMEASPKNQISTQKPSCEPHVVDANPKEIDKQPVDACIYPEFVESCDRVIGEITTVKIETKEEFQVSNVTTENTVSFELKEEPV